MGEAILEKHHSETSVPPSSKTLCLQNHPKTPSKWTSYEREVPPPSPPKKKTVKPPPSCFKRKGSWSLPGNVSLSIPSGVRNKSGSFQSRLILKELYNQGASRIRISATGIPASATLFHYAVCNVDVVCVSETWAHPSLDIRLFAIRNWDRYECWNEQGWNNSLSLSFLIVYEIEREGKERKERKRKRKGEKENRETWRIFARLVENCPEGGRSRRRARRRGWFSREKRARKERITIYLTDGVDDGVEIDWKLLFFSIERWTKMNIGGWMRNLKEGSCK